MLAVGTDMVNVVQHNKSNIVCIAKQLHIISPLWALRDSIIHLSRGTTILGVTFNSQPSSVDHIDWTKNVDKVCSSHS